MRILLVEDDPLLGDGLQRGLLKLGFAVDLFADGRSAVHALISEEYAAVVLDLGLPGLDGMSVLRETRNRHKTTPVLILTARDAIEDKLAGFSCGADDYVIKPVAVEELAARLHALARRVGGWITPRLRCGAVELDLAARQVRLRGEPISLSAREQAILELLMQHAGKVVTRSRIEDALYGWSEGVESNAVEVFIHHLRKKLGSDFIKTLRGIGYMVERDE